mmetsp:Transcript_17698/g.21466  ORF Transcript_17698/g.21466 Transcript_17698/m.21466 type:complete len:245 (-) Transcript_17698:500-1234(-)
MGIVKLGNPVLRQVSRKTIRRTRQRATIEKLYKACKTTSAWGLAAPQIGILDRAFLMAAPIVQNDINLKNKKNDGPLPVVEKPITSEESGLSLFYTGIINPKVTGMSEEIEVDYETCLSIPGIAALVPRHSWIDVEFDTHTGDRREHRLYGHPARVFQHELDHLDGIVYLDRILNTSDIVVESEIPDFGAEDDSIVEGCMVESQTDYAPRDRSSTTSDHPGNPKLENPEDEVKAYFGSMYVLAA